MGIYSEAPSYRTFPEDKPTLLVCWWCTLFAATIVLFRVCGRYIRTEKLFREDWLAFACLIPLFIRMGLVHVILVYGTNNTLAPHGGLSEVELRHRVLGSRLVLASRLFYAATLWMLKLTIAEFFKRLTLQIWKRSYERMLQGIHWVLIATFVAILISDLAECQPITDYWLVNPTNPPVQGQCRQGFVQLLTLGICNVATDILLIIFPIPIILRSQMTVKRKVQLVLLFSLSVVPVGITIYSIPSIIDRHGLQQYRSVWASVEILLATAAANALVLGSFVRDRGVKKAKWKLGSTSDSIERTSTRRGTVVQMHWGSDEDLVRDMGLSVNPALRGSNNTGVRPAPMAHSANTPLELIDETWRFPDEEMGSRRSSDNGPYRDHEPARSPGELSVTTPSRKVSFFDIGGLLDDEQPDNKLGNNRNSLHSDAASMANSATSHELSPTTTHKGSQALLQDVGGLLAPQQQQQQQQQRYPGRTITKSWGKNRASGNDQTFELQSIPQGTELGAAPPLSQSANGSATRDFGQPLGRQDTLMSLQDVGGLLK